MKRLVLLCFFILAWEAGPALATGDYIWAQQFGKKLVKAEAGDTRAQYEVGNMYLKGRGTVINPEEAYKWFSKAADKGYMKAEYKMGMLYLKGTGVKKNTRTAYSWMSKAADKGYGPAQFQLGKMYDTGQGASQNKGRALEWYRKAEASGYSPAIAAIKDVQADIRTEQKTIASAPKPRAAAQPKPKPATVVAKAPARTTAPAAAKPAGKPDSRALLKNSQWTSAGLPANYLPSASTECSLRGQEIICLSDELFEIKGAFELSYVIESVLTKFSGDTFEINHRRSIVDVATAETGGPAASKSGIKKGWEKTSKHMACTAKSDHLIACLSDDKKVKAFSRQR